MKANKECYFFLGTSVVMTGLRSIGNEHVHPGDIGRVAAWCWTETR